MDKTKQLTEDFISKSLTGESVAGLCFNVSYPLSVYLFMVLSVN